MMHWLLVWPSLLFVMTHECRATPTDSHGPRRSDFVSVASSRSVADATRLGDGCGIGSSPCESSLNTIAGGISTPTLSSEGLHTTTPKQVELRHNVDMVPPMDSEVIQAAKLLTSRLTHGSLEPLARELKELMDSTEIVKPTTAPYKEPETLCPKFSQQYQKYARNLVQQTSLAASRLCVAGEATTYAREGTRQGKELSDWLEAWGLASSKGARSAYTGKDFVGETLDKVNETMIHESHELNSSSLFVHLPGTSSDASVAAVLDHVHSETVAWLQLRLHSAQEETKRAIVAGKLLIQWLPLAHKEVEACHRGASPHAVSWSWPAPDTKPHPEWTDDDRIQHMIARVQMDVVRARHHLYDDAREVASKSLQNKEEATRQKTTDLFLLHGAADLAAQKRGDLANMTARLTKLHEERKSVDCEGQQGSKCDQLVRAAAALRRAKATMSDADICDSRSRTSCLECTRLRFCGWCAAERTCLEGDGSSPRFGPKCAASWYHGLHRDPARRQCEATTQKDDTRVPAVEMPDLKVVFDPECEKFLGPPGDCERAKLRMQAEETKCLAEGGTQSHCNVVRRETAQQIAREQMKKQWDKRAALDARERAELSAHLEDCVLATNRARSDASKGPGSSADDRRSSQKDTASLRTALPLGFSNSVLGFVQQGEIAMEESDEEAADDCKRMLDVLKSRVDANVPGALFIEEQSLLQVSESATGGHNDNSLERATAAINEDGESPTGASSQASEAAKATAKAEEAAKSEDVQPPGATGSNQDASEQNAASLNAEESGPLAVEEAEDPEEDKKEDEEEDRLDKLAELSEASTGASAENAPPREGATGTSEDDSKGGATGSTRDEPKNDAGEDSPTGSGPTKTKKETDNINEENKEVAEEEAEAQDDAQVKAELLKEKKSGPTGSAREGQESSATVSAGDISDKVKSKDGKDATGSEGEETGAEVEAATAAAEEEDKGSEEEEEGVEAEAEEDDGLEKDGPVKATGGTGASGIPSSSTGSATGLKADATGPAPDLTTPMPNTDFTGATASGQGDDMDTDHNSIEIFGDQVSPQGFPVDYAEVEAVIGLTGLSAATIKANNGKFCAAISLAVTGDIARANNIVVTSAEDVDHFSPGEPEGASDGAVTKDNAWDEDGQNVQSLLLLNLVNFRSLPSRKAKVGTSLCRVAFTIQVKQANASRAAISYARILADGAVRLQESISAYEFAGTKGRIQAKMLVEPRVLAGNTASDAALARQELEQRTNAEEFRAGEETAEALADHKYSNYRPHKDASVQQLFAMKQKCRNSDCVLRIDEKLNKVMADYHHARAVSDEVRGGGAHLLRGAADENGADNA